MQKKILTMLSLAIVLAGNSVLAKPVCAKISSVVCVSTEPETGSGTIYSYTECKATVITVDENGSTQVKDVVDGASVQHGSIFTGLLKSMQASSIANQRIDAKLTYYKMLPNCDRLNANGDVRAD